ncbi:hypothetical protein LCGC14_1087960 [marine sediment metagenome]|uniref:Uncharacterized protein n=1 Tax=marine sediment metagenome TaxID=412755 RepID=A0A0F9N0Z0_9ZZZZ
MKCEKCGRRVLGEYCECCGKFLKAKIDKDTNRRDTDND